MTNVSVIITSWNSAPHITKAINSVLAQTYKDLEIICVDNNSTDDTCEILKVFGTKNNFTIANETKQGAAATRNKGLELASGDWIQFLDADDTLYPDKLERQLKLIKGNTKLLVGAYDMHVNNGPLEHFAIENNNYWSLLINSGIGNTVSNLWKRSLLKEVGGWNEDFDSSQEYELMFRILKKIKTEEIVVDDKPSMLYNRRTLGSISSNFYKNTITRINLRNTFKTYFVSSSLEKKQELLNETENFILKDLRYLYTVDKNKAIELHSTTISGSFLPEITFVTPSHYKTLYKLLGFKFTEALFAIARKLAGTRKEPHF